jgi:hypothetical protein
MSPKDMGKASGLLLAAAATATLVGCGSSSGRPATLAQFAHQANEICMRLSVQQGPLEARQQAAENRGDRQALAAVFRADAAVSREAGAKVQALSRPPTQAAEIKQLVDAYFQEAADRSSLATALSRGDVRSEASLNRASDSLTHGAAEVARSLGMTACAKVPARASTARTVASSSLPSGGSGAKARAIAYAHAVNLRAEDVPGLVSISPEGEHKEESSSLEAKCGIHESHVHVVDIRSPKFKGGAGLQVAEVRSDVEVLRTAAEANAKVAVVEGAFRSPKVHACLQRVLAEALLRGISKARDKRVQITPGTTSLLPLHPTVPHSFGIRVVIPLTVSAHSVVIPIRAYVDVVGLAVERATVALTTFALSRPFAEEERLLSVLHERASASTP